MLRYEIQLGALFLAVLMFGAYLAGVQASAANPQSSGDQAIVSDIQTKLFADSVLKTQDIRVACQDGVVTLTGTVNTDLEKAAVEGIASHEPGVRQVVDSLAMSETSVGPAPQTSAPSPGAPPSPPSVTVAAGTIVTVQMIGSIDSAKNYSGEEFDATVFSPVLVGDSIAIPQNANARVRLVNVKSAGHIKGQSELQLELVSVTVNGTPYQVESGYYERQGASRGKRSAETVGGGAGLGALIGAIAGGGRGAAIGAGIGAATGTGVQAATKGQQVKVPSEAKLDFTLNAPLTIATGSPAPTPIAPTPQGLSGTWEAHLQGFTQPLKVSIQQTGDRIVGMVLDSDSRLNSYIPAGKMMFYANYTSSPFAAEQICAGANYSSPHWVPVTFNVIDSDHLQEDLSGGTGCGGFPVLWERNQ
jgi:BON domain